MKWQSSKTLKVKKEKIRFSFDHLFVAYHVKFIYICLKDRKCQEQVKIVGLELREQEVLFQTKNRIEEIVYCNFKMSFIILLQKRGVNKNLGTNLK
jgi:hypothetical protein